MGKEVIVRLSTGLASRGVIYTDSNGRDMQRRLRNFRPSWSLNASEAAGFEASAGNYYPMNAVATIGARMDLSSGLSVGGSIFPFYRHLCWTSTGAPAKALPIEHSSEPARARYKHQAGCKRG
jgi:hypothetical protein